MSPEKSKPSVDTLTRKQKLARRFLPLALIAGGAAAYGIAEQGDGNNSPETAYDTAAVSVSTSMEFGGSDSDWGHGTAERAINAALTDGIPKLYALTEQTGDIEQIIEGIPTYDLATAVLEKAAYDDVLPDQGDELKLGLDLTLDSDNHISVEVNDAKIVDLPNNHS